MPSVYQFRQAAIVLFLSPAEGRLKKLFVPVPNSTTVYRSKSMLRRIFLPIPPGFSVLCVCLFAARTQRDAGATTAQRLGGKKGGYQKGGSACLRRCCLCDAPMVPAPMCTLMKTIATRRAQGMRFGFRLRPDAGDHAFRLCKVCWRASTARRCSD